MVATETIGQNAQSSYAQVTVIVENENDNDPVFQQEMYSESLPENIVSDSFVVLVSNLSVSLNRMSLALCIFR